MGTSYLMTFPFWVFVDTEDHLEVRQITVGSFTVRIYPLFRSGPPAFIPMPEVDAHAIPWLPKTAPDIEPRHRIRPVATFPNFDGDPASSLVTIMGDDWGEGGPPRKMPMDTLRLDIYGEPEGEAGNACDAITSALMQHLRRLTRQWWIERPALAGYIRAFFPVSSAGVPVHAPDLWSRGHTGRGNEVAVTRGIWDEAIRGVEGGESPLIYSLIMMDARYFRAARDLRRSVLDAATACEQAKNQTYERLWTSRGQTGKIPSSVGPSTDLPRDLSTRLAKFTNGRSYEQDYPVNFATLKRLWNDRGDVAHGRRIGLESDPVLRDSGNRAYADSFLGAGEHCIGWLERL